MFRNNTTNTSNGNHQQQNHQPPLVTNTKKYTINKNRWQPQWWHRSTSIMTAHISPLYIVIIIGILLYVTCVQYSIIRTKDAAILTILTHPQQPLQSSGQSGTSMSLLSRDLFSHKQYKLLEAFRNKCDGTTSTSTTTGRGVGVFPIRKPSTDVRTVRKIQQRTKQTWKPYSSTVLSQVSYPIFVPSLPKSGTTSIWKYFKCGYQAACHNWIQGTAPGEKSSLLGKCIENNILQNVPPFENCGPYDVYTDSGVRSSCVVNF
jgi:hypothetical protein